MGGYALWGDSTSVDAVIAALAAAPATTEPSNFTLTLEAYAAAQTLATTTPSPPVSHTTPPLPCHHAPHGHLTPFTLPRSNPTPLVHLHLHLYHHIHLLHILFHLVHICSATSIATQADLLSVCPVGTGVGEEAGGAIGGYDLPDLSAAMAAWYRALCAPEGDPAWEGSYDPADQARSECGTLQYEWGGGVGTRRAVGRGSDRPAPNTDAMLGPGATLACPTRRLRAPDHLPLPPPHTHPTSFSQVQQAVLTAGFMCAVACGLGEASLTADAMGALITGTNGETAAREAACQL